MPRSLAPDPIKAQSCVCYLFWTNSNSMAVTFIYLSISLSNLSSESFNRCYQQMEIFNSTETMVFSVPWLYPPIYLFLYIWDPKMTHLISTLRGIFKNQFRSFKPKLQYLYEIIPAHTKMSAGWGGGSADQGL